MEKEKSIDEKIEEAKKKKKNNIKKENNILKEKEIDTSFMDIEKKPIKEKKVNKPKKEKVKKEIKKETKKESDVITLRGEEFSIRPNYYEEEEKKEIKPKKSKIGIFFLIVSLLFILGYGYYLYKTLDFKNLELMDIVKSGSFFVIGLLVILVLFKVNTKKSAPYIVFLSLVLIGYSIFSVSYAKEEDEDIYVLDFINHDYGEVLEWTERYNIDLTTLHEFSDTVEYNHVIMQEYGVTTLVSDIKSFSVTISDGPNLYKELVVPNFTGLKFDDVMKYIKENHLNNVEIEFVISDKEKDTVIEQIGSGTMKRSDLIKFVFSYGEEIETTEVKDLKNLSLFEATTYLKRYGIKYDLEYEFNDKVKKGYVISQDIVNQTTEKVTLKISKGKEIIVPNLSKMTNTEISKWASSNNIKIKYETVYNKNYENGKFIKANKDENDKIEEGSEIIITLSKGSLVMPEIKDVSEFKLWATNNNIKYEENLEFSTTIKSGELISVNPKPGEKITEDDTIVLTISKGKSVITPNLIGLTKTEIINKCKAINLTCTFKYGGLTEGTKKDVSINQSKKSGLTVAEGTNMTITLSSGIQEKVNVPSFKGKNKNEISNTCNSLGITCNFNYNNTYSDTIQKDTAISQDKTGTVNKGSTINITLSIGKAETCEIIVLKEWLQPGNAEQTKINLKTRLENTCPGVKFVYTLKPANSGIGYLSPDSDVKATRNLFTQGKTYNVIINSN